MRKRATIHITRFTEDVNNIQGLSDRPNTTDGLTSQQLKKKFDKAGSDIKSYMNDTLLPEIERIFDIFYPVGTYYETSDSSFNPNEKWGGIWQLENDGTVLVSAKTQVDSEFNKVLGTIVGTEKHKLTIAEIPKHKHGYKYNQYKGQNMWGIPAYQYQWDTYQIQDANTGYEGEDKPHNNIQPSKIVNRWHRIA